jgi:hypothetical protein
MKNLIIAVLAICLAISAYFNWRDSKAFKINKADKLTITLFVADSTQKGDEQKHELPFITFTGIVSSEKGSYNGNVSMGDMAGVRVIPGGPGTGPGVHENNFPGDISLFTIKRNVDK